MTKKIRLLTQEETQGEHEFWEDSPTRIAMKAAQNVIKTMPGAPRTIFVGEHNDGLWIWFLDEDEGEVFLSRKQEA